MHLKEIFGANVRHYRKDAGLTQADLAEKADLSLEMIGKIERGAASPSFETIMQLSGVLNVAPDKFFNAGEITVTSGDRGKLLSRINVHLSKANEADLAKIERMLSEFVK